MRTKKFIVFLAFMLLPLTVYADSSLQAEALDPGIIVMETSMGTIRIELFDQKAPLTSKNFRSYVEQGFYNGLIFHRVIPEFMIQGGGFEPGMNRRNPTLPSIKNEADNGLKNKRGAIAMARTKDINSATSQFFINLVDNPNLDNRGLLPHLFGYAVFGKVIEGMDVVDKIAAVPTSTVAFGVRQYRNVPEEDVTIIKAYEEKRPDKNQ